MIGIKSISYYVPEGVLTNANLNELFPEWSADKVSLKTGIKERRIAASDEFVSDMAIKAAQKLFLEYEVTPESIDFILLCTQSPDFFLPTTACLIQNALNIPTSSGALDFNLGCSGYVYGLALAKGLILTEEAKNILLLTSETYSKHLHANDKSIRTIFGDAATATLISYGEKEAIIQKCVFGTDGSGAENLIVKSGGMRNPLTINDILGSNDIHDDEGNTRADNKLYMSGPDIFTFTIKQVPALVSAILEKNKCSEDEIDLYIFHQANKYMLEHLRKKLNINESRFFISLENYGNTVSSTIPIAIKEAMEQGKIKAGMKVLLAGFGVGYSWSGTIVQF